jgi:hypothetical protein
MTYLNTWELQQALLTCAQNGVDNTGDLELHRIGAVPGEIAWDACECGLLAISEQRRYPSIDFPTEGLNDALPCGAPYTVVPYVIALVRCVPSSEEDGEPPTVEALSAAAEQLNTDIAKLRQAIWCCLNDLYRTNQVLAFTVGASDVVGPEGGCAGHQLTVLVGFGNDCGC